MRRRALLATLAGTTLSAGAGCVIDRSSGGDEAETGDDGSPGQCSGVTIESARVRVDYRCDYGPTTDAEISGSAPDCADALTVELVDGDAVVERRSIDSADEWTARFELDAPIDPGEATIRVRDPDGDVAAERTVAVEHYRDAPHLSVWSPSVDPGTATIGEPVEVTLTVGNVGGAGEFTAELRVEGEPVASRAGSVHAATDCDRASGPEITLSHAFEEPGEYGIGVALVVENSAGSGSEVDLGTVTIEE